MKLLLAGLILIVGAGLADAQVRLKDVTKSNQARDNDLIGYGLVVGLSGTGDSTRNTVFTRQSMKSLLERLGVSVKDEDLKVRNVAAVLVTASAPSSLTPGSRIDVNISSLGDSSSLRGGALVMTPLQGADGLIYAVAQGLITVAGLDAKGQGEQLSEGVPTAGRIPNGAIVERQLPRRSENSSIELELHNPDARTAAMITDTINSFTLGRFGARLASERSARFIRVSRPPNISTTRLIAELGELQIVPDTQARIVIDPRSGTIVMNSAVQILPIAVAHGNLSVRITESPNVSQPAPLSGGTTVVTPATSIRARENGGHFVVVGGGNLSTLIQGLNQVGVKPSGVISILQAIKSAGALQAELIIQ